MIERPEDFVAEFAKAGADILTVPVEATRHLYRLVQQIKDFGIKAGVTLNPATSLDTLEELLSEVDLVLIMSVSPGFGGQSYLSGSTARIARVKRMLVERGVDQQVELEVDGGIKPENAARVVEAGATVLVAGSAIYNSQGSVRDNLERLRQAFAA